MSFNAGDNRFSNDIFASISRANDAEQVKQDTMIMGYTQLIQDRADVNQPRKYYSQLPNNNGVNDRDISLLQTNGFMDDVINASSREQQSSSRFNYAFDRQINKRFIDVSGQFIPNEKLRILPNRGMIIWGKHPEPIMNDNINNLSLRLAETAKDISPYYNPTTARGQLKYNANTRRLTKEDLINSSSQYAKQNIPKVSQQREIQQILQSLDNAWV
jgi:hypothetical protein